MEIHAFPVSVDEKFGPGKGKSSIWGVAFVVSWLVRTEVRQ